MKVRLKEASCKFKDRYGSASYKISYQNAPKSIALETVKVTKGHNFKTYEFLHYVKCPPSGLKQDTIIFSTKLTKSKSTKGWEFTVTADHAVHEESLAIAEKILFDKMFDLSKSVLRIKSIFLDSKDALSTKLFRDIKEAINDFLDKINYQGLQEGQVLDLYSHVLPKEDGSTCSEESLTTELSGQTSWDSE